MKEGKGRYKLTKVLELVGVSKGSWYDKRLPKKSVEKRGPKPKFSDKQVLEAISKVLTAPKFYNEGYKKNKVRLEQQGVLVGKERLRRIMGEAGLLLDGPNRDRKSPYEHNGTIITTRANEMWGTDVKEFYTPIGKIYFMGVIDHYHDKIVGHYVNDRERAIDVIEALHVAVKNEMGEVCKDICEPLGLSLRIDNGGQFESKMFKDEAQFLGIELSNTMVRSPQSNGIIERFHRTLKEQLDFSKIHNLDDGKKIIANFVESFNKYWLLHRLGLRSPLEFEKQNQVDTSGINEPKGVRPA